jgi:HTH-type transcriptional regulator/antitoxin HigA
VFLPRPIHDAAEYDNTSEVTDAMALWQDDFTAGQRDYFDLLCSLVEDFDAAHVKWPRLKGRGILRHLLDERGLAAADLSRVLGRGRNLGAMILRGDRNLTLAHVRKLAAHFKVSPELFI